MSLNLFEETSDGIRLPHPPISLRSLLVIESALCEAWRLVRNKPRGTFNLSTAEEDSITLELHERLYDDVFDKNVIPGFDRGIFASVAREPKTRNFDGTHPDKMPDLFVQFVDRPPGVMYSQHGVFIECKPVDGTHTGGSHYCDKGLIRFIRGDYAWTMTNALMVGYARNGYTVLPKLSNALASRTETIPTLDGPQPCEHSKAGKMNEVIYVSRHKRTFKYVETGKGAPPITIRHLWLKRD
jgi:hypothetical protein